MLSFLIVNLPSAMGHGGEEVSRSSHNSHPRHNLAIVLSALLRELVNYTLADRAFATIAHFVHSAEHFQPTLNDDFAARVLRKAEATAIRPPAPPK